MAPAPDYHIKSAMGIFQLLSRHLLELMVVPSSVKQIWQWLHLKICVLYFAFRSSALHHTRGHIHAHTHTLSLSLLPSLPH